MENILALTRERPVERDYQAVILDPGLDDIAAENVLVAFFARQRHVSGVSLVVGGREAGWLELADFLWSITPQERDIGEADHARLEGTTPPSRLKLIHLVCPVAGCPVRDQWALSFDEPRHRTARSTPRPR